MTHLVLLACVLLATVPFADQAQTAGPDRQLRRAHRPSGRASKACGTSGP